MKRFLTFSSLFLVLLLLSMLGRSRTELVAAHDVQDTALNGATITHADVSDALQSSSVMFIENVGQFDDDARFQVHGGDYNLWLADDALWITLLEAPIELGFVEKNAPAHPQAQRRSANALALKAPRKGVNLKLSFVGANPQPEIEPFDLLETKMNYFLGNDPDKWRSNVPVWGGVRYKNIYPGIDLELTSENGHAVQRFVVHSRANPSSLGTSPDAVQLRVEGAEEMALLTNRTSGQATGVTVKTAIGDVTLPLFTLVTPDGTPLDITSSPTLNSSDIKAPFARHSSPNKLPLVSGSPLAYSTFIGGSGYDYARSLALDSAGNAVITGETPSLDFPTTAGSYDTTYNGGLTDTFVLKLSSKGDALSYSTFIGGSSYDTSYELALDSADNPVITGETWSSEFPTTAGSYDTTHNGGNSDAFVLKLSSAGDALIYSTFIGGSSSDAGDSLALDSAGNAVVTGSTSSSDFPTTTGSYDGSYNGSSDTFVLQLNEAGDALLYNTFIGGSDNDSGLSLALDSAGNAVVMGSTSSLDFPTTTGSYDGSYNGGSYDTFVLQLSSNGDALLYNTFIGGSDNDLGWSLALDSAGNAVVTGYTESDDFPTMAGSNDSTHNGLHDAFVLQLSSAGDALLYNTFIGGSDHDYGYSLALDSAGNAIVTGHTLSDDFPTTSGSYDTTYNGLFGDTFVLKLSSKGDALSYSTFIGGSSADTGWSVALDRAGNAVVIGSTSSSDFPTTTGSYDTTHNGGNDGFVLRLDGLGSGAGATYAISGRVTDSNGAGISDVTVSAGAGDSATTDSNGDYTISGLANGNVTVTPSRSGYTFEPTSRSVTVQGADVTGQDFVGTAISQSGEWQCWDDGSIDPCHNHLNSVDMLSATNGWAVGTLGTILRFNGTAWSSVPSPTTNWLYSVDMVSNTLGWVVGFSGTILRWDGSAWTKVDSPTTSDLYSVAMVSATEGWAVGHSGTILHWDGSAWSVFESTTTNSLSSVTMVSATDGWAVGSSGTILHWDGSTWTEVDSPTSNSLYSVAMVNATEGWAVGYSGTILHWDGSAWSLFKSPTTEWLSSITMVSATEGWAVGGNWWSDNTILHWDGSAWTEVESSVTFYGLSSISISSSTNGWAVGSYGTILRWDGSAWTSVVDRSIYELSSVSMVSSTDGWAVGWNGDVLHWDGSAWTEVASPTTNPLYDVAMASSTSGWAVGSNGTILHWDGNAWTQIASPTTSSLRSLSMVSSTDGWAVGGSGTILHWDGSAWTEVASPTTSSLSSVAMVSATDGWAVSGDYFGTPTILHWDGSTWTEVSSSTTSSGLLSVAMASSTSGWAVGWNGHVLHWDGSAWTQVQVEGLFNRLNDVAMGSSTSGWLVGGGSQPPIIPPQRGLIWHWDGSAWSEVDSPTTNWLSSVAMVSATDGWAVGQNGVILRYTEAGIAYTQSLYLPIVIR